MRGIRAIMYSVTIENDEADLYLSTGKRYKGKKASYTMVFPYTAGKCMNNLGQKLLCNCFWEQMHEQ